MIPKTIRKSECHTREESTDVYGPTGVSTAVAAAAATEASLAAAMDLDISSSVWSSGGRV